MTSPAQTLEQNDSRAFARADAELLMALRIVPVEERQQVRPRLHTPHLLFETPPMDVRDTALAEWLNLLNRKLDAVIKLLEEREDCTAGLSPHLVNIGAGGMSFQPTADMRIGDMLEVKVRFPLEKPVTLSVFGEVVELTRESANIRFIAMTDEISDLIVRFVFQKQREIMMSQRKD